MAEQRHSSNGGNWFVHVYVDGCNPGDPEKWVIRIDHSYHAGQLPFFERQYCPRPEERGGYASVDDIVPLAAEILQDLGIAPPEQQEAQEGCKEVKARKDSDVEKAPWYWYVHKYPDASAEINTVYSNSSAARHCPTYPGTTIPHRFGYPFAELARAVAVAACMDAGNCPPCDR